MTHRTATRREVRVRAYRPGDEGGLVRLWNQALPADPIHPALLLRRVLCDPNFDPEGLLLAEAGGRPVGFALAIVRRVPLWGDDLEPEAGWITAFGVHPDYRRQGVASRLFEAAWDFFRARGRRRVDFASYAPNYFVPGIDREQYPAGAAFLARHGFRKLYECAAMDRSLVGYTYPPDVAAVEAARQAEGYRFVPLSPRYVVPTLRFAREVFHPDWSRAVREGLLAGIPFDRFLLAVKTGEERPGHPRAAGPGERVVGFAMYGVYDGVPERFGPFGVDDGERGKGIGKVLLYKTLDEMHARGLHGAWFLWTGENDPAGHLYRRAGFTVTRRFEVLRKELAP